MKHLDAETGEQVSRRELARRRAERSAERQAPAATPVATAEAARAEWDPMLAKRLARARERAAAPPPEPQPSPPPPPSSGDRRLQGVRYSLTRGEGYICDGSRLNFQFRT
ncbi:MAG: hypothetical protein K2Y71_29225 [Xanthobacteraceae bacterium]|nr:hypothetical protein [Xanthobacteraceae bacterium]